MKFIERLRSRKAWLYANRAGITIANAWKIKKGQEQVPDPTSTYEKHTPERVSPNVKTFF